jgi:hypothetical protein
MVQIWFIFLIQRTYLFAWENFFFLGTYDGLRKLGRYYNLDHCYLEYYLFVDRLVPSPNTRW